jgi:hypothetical protein
MQMGLFAASRLGDFAQVDPTLAQLIGRPPTALRTSWRRRTWPGR